MSTTGIIVSSKHMYRKILLATGEYYHIYNRGNRKEDIFYGEKDMWRFLQSLRFFNDSHSSLNILRTIKTSNKLLTSDVNRQGNSVFAGAIARSNSVFELGWPPKWPEQEPLVKILCYCLLPNHFHLLLKEIRQDGISKFMQKIGIGFSKYSNIKYENVGRLFQGPYQLKLIKEQTYLEYLTVYIQVINVLELFPGGLEAALKDLTKAIAFVDNYIFSSHPDYAGLRKSLIIDKDILGKIFPNPEDYKEHARQTLRGVNLPPDKNIYQFLSNLTLE